jgi:hypothetical protein
MKIKSGKREKSAMHKFDIKTVRDLLVRESKFITELLDKQNFPLPVNNESGTIYAVPLGVHEALRVSLYVFKRKLMSFSKLHRQWAIPHSSLVMEQQLTVSCVVQVADRYA